MYNIVLLPEDSTEKKIVRRQLTVKDRKSNSWFTEVKQYTPSPFGQWGYKNLQFVEDHPMNIHVQFGFDHICSF